MARVNTKIRFLGDSGNLSRAIDKAQNKLTGFSGGVGKLNKVLKQNRGLILGFGSAIGLNLAGREVLDVTLAFEKLQITLSTILKSERLVTEETSFLRKETERLGLNFLETSNSYAKLLASTKDILGLKGSRDLFTALGNAATSLQLSTQDVNLVLLAFQQIASKGKVSSEELRRQLGERLFGAFNLAAKSIGVTTVELDKLLREGKLFAKDFLPPFIEALNKEFGAGVVKGAKSTRAELGRLKNSYQDLLNALGQGGFSEFVKSLSKVIASTLKLGALQGIFSGLGSILKFVSDNIGLVTTSLGLFLAPKIINRVVALTSSFGGLKSRLAEVLSLTVVGPSSVPFASFSKRLSSTVARFQGLLGVFSAVAISIPIATSAYNYFNEAMKTNINFVSLQKNASEKLIGINEKLIKSTVANAQANIELAKTQSLSLGRNISDRNSLSAIIDKQIKQVEKFNATILEGATSPGLSFIEDIRLAIGDAKKLGVEVKHGLLGNVVGNGNFVKLPLVKARELLTSIGKDNIEASDSLAKLENNIKLLQERVSNGLGFDGLTNLQRQFKLVNDEYSRLIKPLDFGSNSVGDIDKRFSKIRDLLKSADESEIVEFAKNREEAFAKLGKAQKSFVDNITSNSITKLDNLIGKINSKRLNAFDKLTSKADEFKRKSLEIVELIKGTNFGSEKLEEVQRAYDEAIKRAKELRGVTLANARLGIDSVINSARGINLSSSEQAFLDANKFRVETNKILKSIVGTDVFVELSEKVNGVYDNLTARAKTLDNLFGKITLGIVDGIEEYANSLGSLFENIKGFVANTFRGMEDLLTDFVIDGRASFKDFANAILADLTRIILRASVIQPFANIITGAFASTAVGSAVAPTVGSGFSANPVPSGFSSANGTFIANALGNAFDRFGKISAFASGGVFNSPTAFSFGSNSLGVLGEAGPEAILPLARGRDGALGVRSVNSGGDVNINVNVNVDGSVANNDDSEGLASEIGRVISVKIRQVIMEEKRDGGLLA